MAILFKHQQTWTNKCITVYRNYDIEDEGASRCIRMSYGVWSDLHGLKHAILLHLYPFNLHPPAIWMLPYFRQVTACHGQLKILVPTDKIISNIWWLYLQVYQAPHISVLRVKIEKCQLRMADFYRRCPRWVCMARWGVYGSPDVRP